MPITPPTKKRRVLPRLPADLAAALSEAHAARPEQVPESATLLMAFVDLPGSNSMETGSFRRQFVWKDAVKDHFGRCMNLQPHPGLIHDPEVYIELHVAKAGDEINDLRRVKFIIDRLQIRREVQVTKKATKTLPERSGVRVHGGFDLLENDDILNHGNTTVKEIFASNKGGVNTRRVLRCVRKRPIFAVQNTVE
ncbi:hypothetical protein GCM10022631_26480 [Deinococcus rubellus]